MITCPNCNHQNPDGALQCEACYTPLPVTVACPSCGAAIQANASFCGQCGADLRETAASPSADISAPDSTIKTQNFIAPDGASSLDEGSANESNTGESLGSRPAFELPDLIEPDPLVTPEPISRAAAQAEPVEASPESTSPESTSPESTSPENASENASPLSSSSSPRPPVNATQLQTLTARLRQVQTNTPIEIPRQLSLIRIGKPNDQTPPDIDVSGFPDSEIVSRVHANLRAEGDVYYVEDVGSSNGTYINGLPLPAGNRHRLRPGDRIALGKGDKVSFIFETAS